jgi:ParB family transcriptional regulator, chromosome partitioning protein
MPQPRRDAIFDTSADMQEIVELNLDQIQPDPKQPRKTFEEESLDELAKTIEEHGQLQPILVRPDPEQERAYIIVSGERRFRAHQRLGRERIYVIIRRSVDERQARAIALVENLQREDLNPVEEAEGLAQLINDLGLTQEEVAKQVGKSRTSITGSLAITRLPEKVREEAKAGTVSKSKLVELAQLGDAERQLTLWEKLKKGITVAEARAAKQQPSAKKASKAKQGKIKLSPTIQQYDQVAKQIERVDAEYFRSKPRDYDRLFEVHTRIGKVLEDAKKVIDEAARAQGTQEAQPSGS